MQEGNSDDRARRKSGIQCFASGTRMSKFQGMSCSKMTSLVLVLEVSLEETSIWQGSSSVVRSLCSVFLRSNLHKG